MRRLLPTLLGLIGTSFLALHLQAQVVWSGAPGGFARFSNGGSWVGGLMPGPSDTAQFGPHGNFSTVWVNSTTVANLEFLSTRTAPYVLSYDDAPPASLLTVSGNVTVQTGPNVTFTSLLDLALPSGGHVFEVGASTTLQVGGIISGPGHFSKNGAGTLVLTGANTYNYDNNHGFLDSTSIHAGTLHLDGGSINHTGLGDIQVSLGPGDTGNLVIDNGGHATDYFGVLAQGSGSTATAIVSGAGSFWDHSSGMDIGHSGVGTLNILNDGDVTITGPWAFLGWTSSGNGTVNLDGMGSTWSIGGEVLVGGSGTGTITVGNHAALHVNAGASNLILGSSTMSSTGTLNIGAALGDTAAAGGLINAAAITTGSGTGTLQFKTIASSASPYYLTRDGTTGGPAVAVSGAVQVINTAGYNVLTGANAYTGGTAITGGTLVAGNDLALGLGAVVLNGGTLSVASGITFSNTLTIGASGGRLSGNGSFSSPLTLGAGVTLAPGTSPGTLHFLSGLALNDGGALEIELQAPGGTPGSNWDLVNITGTLNLGNLTAGGYSLRAISLALDGNPGAVDGLTGPASWVIATASGGITGFEAGDFLIDFSQFTGGGDFSLTLSGNDLLLNFAPVPEPTTYALLATGLVLAGLHRRRKARGGVRADLNP